MLMQLTDITQVDVLTESRDAHEKIACTWILDQALVYHMCNEVGGHSSTSAASKVLF